jgi:hypothetical protein
VDVHVPKPGITNFPDARTIRAPAGIRVDDAGPRAAILSPRITIVLCGATSSCLVSISVQLVSAMV